jgi:aspartate kinase
MARIVMKFGGTSVADLDRIRNVARRVKAEADQGHEVAVVVSAMAGVTNQLVGYCQSLSPLFDAREYDTVVSTGEQVTSGLTAIALQELGQDARSWQGWQIAVETDGEHGKARIESIEGDELIERMRQGQIPVVAGFQGIGPDNRVTTLGRGGSDTTAGALAAALGADCEIYSDVAGVFTADPRVVPDARRLDELSYEEMQELAQAGARVLNAQAVEFAREKGITIHARSTFGSADETAVRGGSHPERIAGVAVQKELALLTFPAARLPAVVEELERAGAAAAELARPGAEAGLALSLENVHGWPVLRERLRAAVPELSIADEGLGAVSVVGTRISAGHRVLREVVAALEGLGAPPRALFTSALRVTAYCDARVLPDAARALHRRLLG